MPEFRLSAFSDIGQRVSILFCLVIMWRHAVSALPKDTITNLPAYSPHFFFRAERQAGKLSIPLLSLFVRADKEMNPRSTDCGKTLQPLRHCTETE